MKATFSQCPTCRGYGIDMPTMSDMKFCKRCDGAGHICIELEQQASRIAALEAANKIAMDAINDALDYKPPADWAYKAKQAILDILESK